MDSPEKAGVRLRRLRQGVIGVSFLFAGLIWAVYAWSGALAYRKAMAEVRVQMSAGRFATAARKLDAVLDRYSKSDEAAYLLGVCEWQSGDLRGAAAAWTRIEPGSPSSERALAAYAQALFSRGRLRALEEFVSTVCRDARHDATGVRALLIPSLRQTGRVAEAQQLAAARWRYLAETGRASRDLAVRMLRMHIELADRPPSIESWRAFNIESSRRAPDDDRVWLSRADLAIMVGDLDEANRWIQACLKARSNDVPTWQSRLRWAMAAGRVEEVAEALKHLPAGESPAQVHRISAWIAARRGNLAVEQCELERLIAVAPADLPALSRLIELAEKDGRFAIAAELIAKKAKVIRLQALYAQFHDRQQPVRHAVEMAQIAEKLGRTFEAQAFLTLAAIENPGRDILRRDIERLIRSDLPGTTSEGTMSQAVASELASFSAMAVGEEGQPPFQ